MSALILLLALFSTQVGFAQTLKSGINFNAQQVNTQRSYSKKVKIHVDDLYYRIPIMQDNHEFNGYLEFDPAFLVNKRSQKTTLITREEVTELITRELEKTKLELKFSKKYLYVKNISYSPLIIVDVKGFSYLSEKLLRVYFTAKNQFPLEVKEKYLDNDLIIVNFKFKFKANKYNFFTKSKQSRFRLRLSNY
jgi:hypothetical protein